MDRAEPMDCRSIASGNVIERYLAGTLSEVERNEFELHYFGCVECFEALETVRAVQRELTAAAPRRRRPGRWWGAAAAAAAAGVLLAILAIPRGDQRQTTKATPPAAVPLIQLAEIRPPEYQSTTYRGAAGAPQAEFARAMKRYQDGDYAGAWSALSAIHSASPHYAEARHFGGVSLLLLGRTGEAIECLDAVVALGAKTPFEEEARYYRALALWVAGQREAGRAELSRVVEMQGDYEERARGLLER